MNPTLSSSRKELNIFDTSINNGSVVVAPELNEIKTKIGDFVEQCKQARRPKRYRQLHSKIDRCLHQHSQLEERNLLDIQRLQMEILLVNLNSERPLTP